MIDGRHGKPRDEIGDRVRLREGVRFKEFAPPLSNATGTVCDVKEGPIGTLISVNYPDFSVLAADVSVDLFEPAPAPPPATPPQHRAVAFIQDAGHFLRAAEIVDEQTRSVLGAAPTMLAPIYFLLGHSMELLLKAFLLAHGMTEGESSKPRLRHSLPALLVEANQHGFSAPAAFSTMVGALAPYHGAFAFRYRKTGRMVLPEVQHVCSAIKPMVAEVDRIVRREFKALSETDLASNE